MNPVTLLTLKSIHPEWLKLLNTELSSQKKLIDVLDETLTKIINLKVKLCPDDPGKILRCLRLNPNLIKVVILNDYPYPQPNVSTGLAFAVKYGDTRQPSLNMLIRELQLEYPDCDTELFDTTLTQWEEQGVLLLNSSLSCEQFKLGSHAKLWEEFTIGILEVLNDFKITRKEMISLVFVFLGGQAQLFESEISDKLHYKIMRYHPTSETDGRNKFTGFFKEVNQLLEESGQTEIQWI